MVGFTPLTGLLKLLDKFAPILILLETGGGVMEVFIISIGSPTGEAPVVEE